MNRDQGTFEDKTCGPHHVTMQHQSVHKDFASQGAWNDSYTRRTVRCLLAGIVLFVQWHNGGISQTFPVNGFFKYFSALQGNENTCSFPYTFYVSSYHATRSTVEWQYSSPCQLKDF
jgi:hypothetical protein